METMHPKYKIGDRVRVRNGVKVGGFYTNKDGSGDYFTTDMQKHKGKEATIIAVESKGYRLDIDESYLYTDGMLVTIIDTLANNLFTHEEYHDTVVLAVLKSQLDNLSESIDKSLDEGNEELFSELSSTYVEMLKCYNKLLETKK